MIEKGDVLVNGLKGLLISDFAYLADGYSSSILWTPPIAQFSLFSFRSKSVMKCAERSTL
jgi:hypothetical protein